MNNWKKISEPVKYPDFITHLNYLNYLKRSSNKLQLKLNRKIEKKIVENKYLKLKVKLINLTLENLKLEFVNIRKFPEYSIVCVSWMPVKAYYVFFNLILILEYLISSNESCLSSGHKKALKEFKKLMENEDLVWNVREFNLITKHLTVEGWRVPRYENLRTINSDNIFRYKQILRKLLDYKKEDFRRERKTKKIVGKNKEEFFSQEINLCEFFYWYRIKANYRDMEFIDKNVPIEDFFKFYNDYYNLSINFYKAIIGCIKILSFKRLGKEINFEL